MHRHSYDGCQYTSINTCGGYTVRIKKGNPYSKAHCSNFNWFEYFCVAHKSKEQLFLFPLVSFLFHVCHAWLSTLPLKMTMSLSTLYRCKWNMNKFEYITSKVIRIAMNRQYVNIIIQKRSDSMNLSVAYIRSLVKPLSLWRGMQCTSGVAARNHRGLNWGNR